MNDTSPNIGPIIVVVFNCTIQTFISGTTTTSLSGSSNLMVYFSVYTGKSRQEFVPDESLKITFAVFYQHIHLCRNKQKIKSCVLGV